MFLPPPRSILYCYGQWHKFIPELESMGVIVHSGVPPDSLLEKLTAPYLLVLDDLMYSIAPRTLVEYFTKRAHHENFGIIFITQNLFEKSLVVPRNNASYIVLTRSPNSQLQIRTLGSQIFTNQLPFFLDAYRKATEKPYGSLLIDLHPASKPILRLRTNIFPGEDNIIFVPGRL